jgi:putative endonuclease
MDAAYAREKQVQGWSRQKKKALIEGDFDRLINFSKNFSQFGKSEES